MVDVSSSDALLRVARVLHGTTAEGPGQRTAVWFQGCSIRCRGCINPHLFTIHGGTILAPEQLIKDVLLSGDEGLTLLGGEPFDQAQSVANLAFLAQDAGLGVICFTGYAMEAARAIPHGEELLRNVDLLVDGPFVANDPETKRALVGSANQQFIHLTPRYARADPENGPQRIDLRISSSGETAIAGFLTTQGVSNLSSSLNARRSLRLLY